jgi:hypothetical protein
MVRAKIIVEEGYPIKPDITIIEPENLSILHDYVPLDQIETASNSELPSKDFGFGGNSITFELKYIRNYSQERLMKAIWEDFDQIMRLFRILDGKGMGSTIYSYQVIFDKYGLAQHTQEFQEFLNHYGVGDRHKIVYKSIGIERLRRRRWENLF